MCKKEFFLIVFVLVLGLAGTAWAIPFDEANVLWNLHVDDPRADEMGPSYSTLSDYYYAEVEEVTGGEAGEHWDGWAAPSAVYWWSLMYNGDAVELKPWSSVTLLIRVRMGNLSSEQNVVSGLYDGGCVYSEYPSYGIEFHYAEPVFVVTEAGKEGHERTELPLGEDIEVDTWYDISGTFDPDWGDVMILTVAETGGEVIGEASAEVLFDELYWPDYPEWEIFLSPCGALGGGEGDGHIELIAVWTRPSYCARGPRPVPGEQHVRCDVNQVCFKSLYSYGLPYPEGPFDYYVYFKADDPYDMPLVGEFHDVELNDPNQMCVNVGATEPGKTYYWRVDINDQNEPYLYRGPVFEFTKWGYAVNPKPEDGAADMFLSIDTNWQNDGYASEFDAFFGDNEADVDASEQGLLVGDTQGFYDIAAGQEDEGIDPGVLEFGKTYYWRVDECNDPCGCVHGDVWNYTTGLCDPIDDFEEYTGSGGANPIADTWRAWNSSPPTPDEDNGGDVYCQTVWDDAELVYEGDKSMRFKWWGCCTWDHYALVQREFEPDRLDLLAGGTKSISIQYRACELDTPFEDDTLYMELEDVCDVNAKVVYTGDVCDPCWATWYIALTEFTDDNASIKLDKIRYVRIGAETDHHFRGLVNTYWDMMMRCAPYCVPGEGPTGDISGPEDEPDCVVDEWDLTELVARWLDEENLGDENFFQDNIIDFKDYAILAENWMEEELWPAD
ncbi:hypothetical protein ACFL1G_10970 [Planctomycetota bacterium]